MDFEYKPNKIEKEAQKFWKDNDSFKTDFSKKDNKYSLYKLLFSRVIL